jgi:hypothetical protein
MWSFLLNKVMQDEGLYVYNMHDIVENSSASALHPYEKGAGS